MSLKEKSTFDLVLKQQILENIIKQYADDPRGVKEPKRQLAIIEAELKLRKDVKPQNKKDEEGNLTVGLKTLRMSATNKR